MALVTSLVAVASVLPVANAQGAQTSGHTPGCSPVFWRTNTWAWEEYETTQRIGPIFGSHLPQANDTMMRALYYPGGTGLEGARQYLLKAATAALLNAASERFSYPLRRYQAPPSPDGFVRIVRNRLAGTNQHEIRSYAGYLFELNNHADCPLD